MEWGRSAKLGGEIYQCDDDSCGCTWLEPDGIESADKIKIIDFDFEEDE